MKAEIISIGTELLLGEIINTNAAFIAGQLPLLGIDVHFIVTVGDNRQRLIDTLAQSSRRSDIIITTGGLGPTQDDITRESIAEFLHEDIIIDPKLAKNLENLFARYKIEMSPTNIKQAGIIPSARTIDNEFGSAPGWWVEKNDKIIIVLPGPTGELKNMWFSHVFPELRKRSKEYIMSRTLKIFNMPEARVDEKVSQHLGSTNPTLATYAKSDGIHLRLTAKGKNEVEIQNLIAQKEKEIREILNNNIWGVDSEKIEDVVLRLLTQRKLTLSIIEAGIGSWLSKAISDSEYSGECFTGGMILPLKSIGNFLKTDINLIEQYDRISPEIASAMASEIRTILNSDVGIGIIGQVNSRTTGNKQKSYICIGIDFMGQKVNYSRSYPGESYQIRQLAVVSCLFELRKIIVHGGKDAFNS